MQTGQDSIERAAAAKQRYDEVLRTEYSEDFDTKRKRAMVMSFYKYGVASKNYPDGVDAIASLRKQLEAYDADGNMDHLVDVANYAMLEYMFPRHKDAHYSPTDSSGSVPPVGVPYRTLPKLDEWEDSQWNGGE